MEKFRFLYTTKFNGKRFCVLSNENYIVYILEILNDGKLCYPQYDDYIGFYKRFQEFTRGKIKLRLEEIDTESRGEINSEGEVPKQEKKYSSFIPKVIKDGILILAISALALSGCAFPSSSQASWEEVQEQRIEERINSAHEKSFEVEYDSELQRYITKSYISSKSGDRIIICTTNDELKAYFPDKNQNPTYEDVISTIEQNVNIPEKFKQKFIDALKKMKEQMPKLDLFVLNLNAERMTVREKKSLGNAAGNFTSATGNINYIEGASDFTIIHEFLGHALLGGEFEIEDGVIVEKTFRIPENRRQYSSEDDTYYYYTLYHGVMVEEYLADKIGEMLTGEKKDNSNPYSPTNYLMEMSRLSCDYSIEDLINEGPTGLAIAMYENDVYGVAFMDDLDHLTSRYNIGDYDAENPKYGVTINIVGEAYWTDWAQEKFAREEEGIIERAIACIDGTGYTDGVYYVYGTGDGTTRTVDSSTPQQLMEIVKTELMELDKSRTTSIGDFFDDLEYD